MSFYFKVFWQRRREGCWRFKAFLAWPKTDAVRQSGTYVCCVTTCLHSGQVRCLRIYVLQLFEFGHSFQRLLLPFFVCCDFLDSTHTNPCFAFSLFEHHLLDLSAFTNKLTRTSLVHFFCFYQSHESRRFAFPLFFAPSGQFCRHVCCCVPLADCVCAPPVFCIRVSYDARAYFR